MPVTHSEISVTPSLIIEHVAIVDVVNGATRPNMTVVVSGNRIAAIYADGTRRTTKGSRVVNGAGKYLIPGLWDMHVHAFTFPESTMTLGERATRVYFPQYLAAGVTGIRDMGGWLDTVVAVRRRVRAHEILGPRIVAAGRLLGGRSPWAPPSPHVWVVNDPDSASLAVDSLRRAGADFIKVHDLLKRDVYLAIARRARETGIQLVGHLRPSVTVDEAIDAGQVGFEHVAIELVVACAGGGTERAGQFYDRWIKGGWPAFVKETAELWAGRDSSLCAATMEHMRRIGVHVTPTLVLRMQDSVFMTHVLIRDLTPAAALRCASDVKDWGSLPDSLRQLYYRTVLDIVGTLHRAHVVVVAGTDGPSGCLAPGTALHEELEKLVLAGLTPAEALRAATIEPARFLNLADSLGTIEVGKVADLVLIEADPLENISNTRKVFGMVADGRWIQVPITDRDGTASRYGLSVETNRNRRRADLRSRSELPDH